MTEAIHGERRYKQVLLTPELVVSILREPNARGSNVYWASHSIPDLPDDFIVQGVHHDHYVQAFVITVGHASFPPVPFGECLPRLDLRVKPVPAPSNDARFVVGEIVTVFPGDLIELSFRSIDRYDERNQRFCRTVDNRRLNIHRKDGTITHCQVATQPLQAVDPFAAKEMILNGEMLEDYVSPFTNERK